MSGTKSGGLTAMKIKTIGYFTREAFTSIRRNFWIGLASMSTVAVSLIIVGISLLVVVNTNYLAGQLESEVEITAYLKSDIGLAEAGALEPRIKAVSGVEKATFVNKAQALQELRQQLGDKQNMVDALGGDNPLPHLYRVRTVSAKDVNKVAEALAKLPEVEEVAYGKGVVERLLSITKWVRAVGLIGMVLLGLAAVFLIATTIRLTVFARRKEIQIMKVIGATDWFIRWPFLMEGMILGFAGALIATGVVDLSYLAFIKYIRQDLNLAMLAIRVDTEFIAVLSGTLLGVGMLLGAIGSGISIRKFLKV